MTDIHSHVLPGVDDGSMDVEMSLDMLDMAFQSGVDTLVMTPHGNIPDLYENYADSHLLHAFQELEKAKEEAGIPIRLIRGMEVYTTDDMPELFQQKKLLTINGTHYMLMEFAFDEDPDFASMKIEEIQRLGVRPVIAHPERYFFIQDDLTIAFHWCVTGCALQVNKGSLLGKFGPGPEFAAHEILKHNLAACIASDAHRSYSRTTHMGELREFLIREYDEDFAELMLKINPDRIIQGRRLFGYEPVPF